jgi:hypothetical protein
VRLLRLAQAPTGVSGEPEKDWEEYFGDPWGAWGSPFRWRPVPELGQREGATTVTRFRVAITSKGDDQAMREPVTNVLRDLEPWWSLAADWIEVLTGQDLTHHPKPITLGVNPRMWTDGESGPSFIYSLDTPTRMISMPDERVAPRVLDAATFQRVMDVSGAGERPPLEWSLLRDARSSARTGLSRRAVIDACTAVELAITRLIEDRLATENEAVKAALLDGWRMLGKRTDLLKRLGGADLLPEGLQKGLIEPRNAAAHKGAQIRPY